MNNHYHQSHHWMYHSYKLVKIIHQSSINDHQSIIINPSITICCWFSLDTIHPSVLFFTIHHPSIHSSSMIHPFFTMNNHYHHYSPLFTIIHQVIADY